MGDNTGIEWTDATWNPLRGCTKVSAGCDNCYAMTVAHRFSGPGQPYEGLTRVIGGRGQWNGTVRTVPSALDQPLRWTRPRRIFVNSMSDLFHEDVPFWFLDQVFAVMALARQHTFQVLTKRPERMLEYFSEGEDALMARWGFRAAALLDSGTLAAAFEPAFPLPNVWLGVSVEDQATANERIPLLLDTPAAVRWISAEPLLRPIDIGAYVDPTGYACCGGDETCYGNGRCPVTNWPRDERGLVTLDWVVVGGESGKNARPMHPDWARALRDQCVAAGVPFLFKQWGEYGLVECDERCSCIDHEICFRGGKVTGLFPKTVQRKLGKKKAGRELDGRTWDEYP